MKRFLVLGLTLLPCSAIIGQTTPDGIYHATPPTVPVVAPAAAAPTAYQPSAAWTEVAPPSRTPVSVHAPVPQAAQAPLPRIAPAQDTAPQAMPQAATPAATPATPPTVTATAPPPAYFDPLQPLGGMVWRAMPTAPTVPAGVCATGTCPPGTGGPACGAPLFPTTRQCGPSGCVTSRPCLERVIDWLTYHPGPSVLPLFTPTPHHAPLRDYFACPATQTPGYAAGGCASGTCGGPTAGCGAGCGGSGTVLTRALGIASGDACAAPKHKGLGLFAHPSAAGPTTCSPAYDCVPVAVPLPAVCVGYGAGCRGSACGSGALSRVLRHFTPGHGSAGGCTNPTGATPDYTAGAAAAIATPAAPAWSPTWSPVSPQAPTAAPTVMGYVPAAPASPGYHFADPTSNRQHR